MEKLRVILGLFLVIGFVLNIFTSVGNSGIINLVLLTLWLLFIFVNKFKYFVSVRAGLFGLVLVALLLIIGNRGLAEKVSILSYILFVIGFVQSMYENRG